MKKGQETTKSKFNEWIKGRETKKQLYQSIKHAIWKVRQEHSDFDKLFFPESLADEVAMAALVPILLLKPDYDLILRRSMHYRANRDYARRVLELFFQEFRDKWEKQPAFGRLQPLYEQTVTRLEVEKIARATDKFNNALKNIAGKIQSGIAVFKLSPELPSQDLVNAYLVEIAGQKPYVLWNDATYIDRTVDITEDLFGRAVEPYDQRILREEKWNAPKPLEEVLANDRKLVLLGEPGLGKTTSLLHLAWETANHARISIGESSGDIEIPIHIELKYYVDREDLETLIARQINNTLRAHNLMLAPDIAESASVLKVWLEHPQARFLLLFDGLNEVRPEYHTSVRGMLKGILTSHHRMVIACRERDYDQSLRDQVTAFVLQGLQIEEAHTYLRRVLGGKGDDLFKEQILGNTKMRTLVANPLMLWLISIVAQLDPMARLPANRGKLFQQFTLHMPRLRATEGIGSSLSFDLVIAALAKLAFEMQKRGLLAVKLDEVRSWNISTYGISIENILVQSKDWRYLKSDGRMGEPIEFLHQLFLEYFAAVYLNSQLRNTQNYTEIMDESLLTEQWNEVIEMLAGISDCPAELVKWLSKQEAIRRQDKAVFLVKRCFDTTSAAFDVEAREALTDAIVAALEYDNRFDHVKLVNALGDLSDPRAVSPLIGTLGYYSEIRKAASDALVRIGAQAVNKLISGLREEDKLIRWHIAGILTRMGSIVVEPLITALKEEDKYLSWYATETLGRIGSPAVEPLIATLQTANKYVCRYAALALWQIGNPKSIEPLIAALRDEDPRMRYIAAVALGDIGDQRALPELKRVEQEDDSIVSFGSVSHTAKRAAEKIRRRIQESAEP